LEGGPDDSPGLGHRLMVDAAPGRPVLRPPARCPPARCPQ
jgi:hypothetical protein